MHNFEQDTNEWFSASSKYTGSF